MMDCCEWSVVLCLRGWPTSEGDALKERILETSFIWVITDAQTGISVMLTVTSGSK